MDPVPPLAAVRSNPRDNRADQVASRGGSSNLFVPKPDSDPTPLSHFARRPTQQVGSEGREVGLNKVVKPLSHSATGGLNSPPNYCARCVRAQRGH
eukprot:3413136-Pyramimonas_sp.AAC.1